MDAALLLLCLGQEPVRIDAQAVLLPGLVAPIVLPAEWLPDQQHALWLIADPKTPRSQRLEALLQLQREAEAWRLIRALPSGLAADPGLLPVLRRWSRQGLRDLGQSGGEQPVLLIGPGGARDAAGGLRDALGLVDTLPRPHWIGPLLIVRDPLDERLLPQRQQTLLRPALPVLRIDAELQGPALREAVADAVARLLAARAAPPEATAPGWLVDGLAACARARSRGEGPSPRAMAQIRSKAGAEKIRALLTDHQHDEELAMAVVAACLRGHVVARLPALFDLLWAGADGLSALSIAYGWSPQHLADMR